MTRIKLKYNHSISRRGSKSKKSKSIPTRVPTRIPKRVRSPSLSDLSDDDGYSAIEEITDNEDDERDVVAAEERHLTKRLAPPPPPPRPQSDDEDADDEEVDDADDDDDEDDDDEDDDDKGGEIVDHGYSGGEEAEDGFSDDNLPPPSSPRVPPRPTVRFAGVPSSDSESSDTDEDLNDHSDFFPDLFINKGDLDPSFRRELDFANHEPFYGDLGPIYDEDEMDSEEEFSDAVKYHVNDEEEHSSPRELINDDGYESEGDTTEDDIPEPLPRQSLTEQVSPTSESEDTVLIKRKRGKARIGSFQLDRTDKPTAVYSAKARRIIIFTPRQKQPTPESALAPDDPFQFAQWPTDQQVFLNVLSAYNAAMAEQVRTAIEDEYSDYSNGDEDEIKSESDLNVDDFLQWGDKDGEDDEDDESVHEVEADDDDGKSYTTRGSSAMASENPAAADYISHLTSLMPDKMGSFRRNQADQKLIFSERATHDSLAFSGPYNATAVRGLKSDRIATASSPLTPARRRNPFNEAVRLAESRKRNATAYGAHYTHKRQRTLSDV